MTAAALERALADAGLPCTVEARDRLAVLVAAPAVAGALAGAAARERALALATAHGFTHLALELRLAPAGSPPGAGLARAPLPRA